MEHFSAPKRARSLSISSGSDGDGSANKLARLPPSNSGHRLICTLPPTCSPPNHPYHLQDPRDLESHYALYHAHVCEVRGCNAVFPEERFLELHHTECHDPLAQIKQERGEKVFACFLPRSACPKLFLTPKARRLHLISAHNYPKQYFFAVTNKGIGGLLKKWGEGATMLRGEWTPRSNDKSTMQLEAEATRPDEAVGDENSSCIQNEALDTFLVRAAEEIATLDDDNQGGDYQMEDLETSLHSLALVPDEIRFGRGSRQRGFVRGGAARRGGTVRHSKSVAGKEIPDNDGSHDGRNRRDAVVRQKNGSRDASTTTDNTEAKFVVVNPRGRGRGRIYIPS